LKKEVIGVLKEQGFKVNPHIRLARNTKQVYKRAQSKSGLEQIALHKNFLLYFMDKAREYCRNGIDIHPEKISLEFIRSILFVLVSNGRQAYSHIG